MTRSGLIALALVTLAACARILGYPEPGPHAFEHRAHVLAGVACVECHRGVASAGREGPLHLPDATACRRCHGKPHTSGDCLGCHGDRYTAGDLIEVRRHLKFEHRRHAEVGRGECIRCHGGVADGDGHLRPTMATCFRCHQHEAARAGRDCGACHVDLEEEGTLPASHLTHDGDWLREHGARAGAASDLCAACHDQRFCASCHASNVPLLPAQAHFDDPLAASPHRAGFRARHAEEARAEPGLCSTCHSVPSCQGCHEDEGVGATAAGAEARSPHPSGWVGLSAADNDHGRAARRDPTSCATCHGGAGEALCVSCHRVGGVGGDPHPAGFSSRQSLGDLPCRLCHQSGP